MDVSLATFLVASFLFSALNKREEIESSQFVAQQRERKKEGTPRSSANRPSEEEETTYFSSCRDNVRSNASFVVVVVALVFFSVSLRLPSVSKSFPPEEDIFHCGERERLLVKEKEMKKRQKCRRAKKKCARQTRKRDEGQRFFRPLFFCPFLSQIKILIKERARTQ